jgi:hypothetical protein
MSIAPDFDIFGPGSQALALARAAFGGRGFFTPVRRRQLDGTWLGPSDAIDLEARGLVRIPYTFGEPEEDRRERLARAVAGAGSVSADPSVASIVPTPMGEPQGLDTMVLFTACRLAFPAAHIIADLEILGHKLGQLCLAFGGDELMGSIVPKRELRLGARASSRELTSDEAAALLRAAGFAPYERLPDGKVRER